MKLARWFRPAHLPALLIMLLLFYLSGRPGDSMPPLPSPWDKAIHFFAYGVLGASFCLWVRGSRWEKSPWLHIGLVWLACLLFGLSDEFHQSFVPNRSVSLGDLGADLGGSLLAILLYRVTRFYKVADRLYFSLRPWGPAVKEPGPGK